jgi:hypothetical protein
MSKAVFVDRRFPGQWAFLTDNGLTGSYVFNAGLRRRCPEVGFEEIAIDLLRARFWTTFALRAGCSPVLISPLAPRASRPNRHLRPQQEM